MPFYILYAGNSIGLSGVTLGIITFSFAMAGTVTNLVWGDIADARGFRLVFILSIMLWIVASAMLLVAPTFSMAVVVFAGIGAASQGFENSSRSIVLEFGDRDNRPARIAIANTVAQVAGSVGPLLGGAMATWYGYESVFIAAIFFLVVGAALVYFYVPEPRCQREESARRVT